MVFGHIQNGTSRQLFSLLGEKKVFVPFFLFLALYLSKEKMDCKKATKILYLCANELCLGSESWKFDPERG